MSGGAEIDREVEAAQHRRKSIRKVLGHAIEQECGGTERRCALLPQADQRAVENHRTGRVLSFGHKAIVSRLGAAADGP
jgi:hypothetical protein